MHVGIKDNTIDSSNVGNPGSGGLEIDGVDVLINNNVISNIPAEGIELSGVSCVNIYDVSGYPRSQITRANLGQSGAGGLTKSGGLFINGVDVYGDPAHVQTPIRQNRDINVQSLTSSNNAAGVALYWTSTSTTITNVTIQNSCLSQNPPNNLADYLFGQVGDTSSINISNSCPSPFVTPLQPSCTSVNSVFNPSNPYYMPQPF